MWTGGLPKLDATRHLASLQKSSCDSYLPIHRVLQFRSVNAVGPADSDRSFNVAARERRYREGRSPRVLRRPVLVTSASVLCAAVSRPLRRRRGSRCGSCIPVQVQGANESLGAPSLGNLCVNASVPPTRLVDELGRVALPRGIAFGGLSKVPQNPNGATHIGGASFYDHRSVSFFGRPCPLDELDSHLGRIRSWGITFLRLIVTWEAVEHRGPGEYDEEYLSYIRTVCERAGKFGFAVLVDPHQDVWSRWTGGDGAPGWTLEAAGITVGPRLHQTGAAFLHQEHGDPLPSMSWPSNYDRLGCATMMSLFWAGDRLAPGIRPCVGDAPSWQDLLQGRFAKAMAEVAKNLRDVDCVLGFETINEPHPGWLGVADLGKPTAGPITSGITPFEQMRAAAGDTGIWADKRCLWAKAGVWDDTTGQLLDPIRFQCKDWMEECFAPFVERYAAAIREQMPHAVIGVCPPAFGAESKVPYSRCLPKSTIWTPHFYDGMVLVGKVWDSNIGIEETQDGERILGGLLPAPSVKPVFGLDNKIEAYKRQMSWKAELGGTEVPTIIGEVGVPFDIGDRAPDFTASREAMDAQLRAMEELFMPFCWWNYTPDNCSTRGDGWNGEDLSLYWTPSEMEGGSFANIGNGRCLEAFVRPSIVLCAGTPVKQTFNLKDANYRCEFKPSSDAALESVFFVPRVHYQKKSTAVLASPGDKVNWDESSQTLTYQACVSSTKPEPRAVLELRRR